MANLRETSVWEAGIYQLETSDPVMGGENGIDNKAPRQLANRTLWLKNELTRAINLINQNNTNLDNQKANKATQFTAGNGLTGGGDFSVNRTIALGTPSKITANSINTAVSNTHSHEIDKASTTVAGIVQLNDTLTSTATNQALTAAQGKALNDTKLGNSGHQTINGQLGITRNAWEKMRFTNSDGSFWRLETAPISNSENGARFNYVFVGADNNEIGRISFPRVSSGETIAYQSWVQNANVASANRLATARQIAITGDGTGRANFDGTANTNIALMLANSGVTAGSYNSVTVDAKGRVIAGLTQTHGLVTATAATGTANTATTNANTYLNIVASGVGSASSVGSSTQITGTNGISVSSDTAGKLVINQDLANTLTDSSATKSLTAAMGKKLNDEKAPIVHRHSWADIDQIPNLITNPTKITEGDLDTYTNVGFYYCDANVQAEAIANTPVNRAFGLQVVRAAGIVQIFYEYASSNVFVRSKSGSKSPWTAWKRLATTEDNAPSATKLQTARNIAITGDGSWNVNFDGSGNVTGDLTLSNSGVTAGSYNSVTVDAKGRVTAGLTQTHGLVTATTATGTANTATTNANTFLNIVASGVGRASSVGSSTQITGTNGISVSSDTAGKVIITRDSNSPTADKLKTARNIALTGAVTGSVGFDGSGNVSIATTLTKATVKDYNRTINATAAGQTTNSMDLVGQVVVGADGRITQYFHLKQFRDIWFAMEENAIGIQNQSFYGRLIPLTLWTTMPNKVLSVKAQLMRATSTTHSPMYTSEAIEHEVAWAIRKQGNDKGTVWIDIGRTHGSMSEHIDLFVTVEGY